jgi:hypothetical protein
MRAVHLFCGDVDGWMDGTRDADVLQQERVGIKGSVDMWVWGLRPSSIQI